MEFSVQKIYFFISDEKIYLIPGGGEKAFIAIILIILILLIICVLLLSPTTTMGCGGARTSEESGGTPSARGPRGHLWRGGKGGWGVGWGGNGRREPPGTTVRRVDRAGEYHIVLVVVGEHSIQ